ncbi:HAMP domain-containing protein [Sphaerisporangium album]|uniref:histidine kinase n=1 Tax=Sphaerisporangium album TaxID=509200 RepID=A0A367FCT3_9ACTN|nr:nitrate- and nitrite sensing domain-containing protein [Sphaerisporangium album]RCG28178.1 HAMP domain-containing protein [Sphaerisporangium album]
MRFRNSRIRTKVTALLLSLVALWGFAAWVTLREGFNVLWVATLNSGIADPGERLRIELQQERRLTLVLLGAPGSSQQRIALSAQRTRTDNASADFRRQVTGAAVQDAADESLRRRIEEATHELGIIRPMREQVDEGLMDRARASVTITRVIDALYRVYDSMATLDDADFAKDTRTMIELSRANELLAQEDALVAGALAAGGPGESERAQFAQLVGTQRFLFSKVAAELPAPVRPAFDQMAKSEPYDRLRRLENQLMVTPRPQLAPVDGERWKTASSAVISQVEKLIVTGGATLVERARPIAIGVVVRLALAGGLGLIAVIASIVLSITTARALVRRLEELRTAALELAGRKLPNVVERLGHGEDVDVAAEAPPLATGNDAIGQVGQAFNTVQQTAIRVAVEQAELRRSYRGILLSLARRTQSLVHRQLTILDSMERRETEPAELADLFRVDHLATRMRRNAENLIVLSGASPGRAWRRSVPMVDVVRGALAEVEDYTQVTLMPMGEAELAGRAIGDVIHLLAELIENAVSFSPPYASVQVTGQGVAKGYVVEIEDRGLGMTPEDLADANERIADPPEFKLSGTPRLGLYVVSRLASRHNIKVTLKASPYGGTTVVVLIPRELIDGDADLESGTEPMTEHDAPAPGAAVPAQGRHRTGEFPAITRDPRPAVLPAPPAGEMPGTDGTSRGRRENAREGRPAGMEAASQDLHPLNGRPGNGTRDARPAQGPTREAVPGGGEDGPAFTPSGLPRRVAQAHLAPELRHEPAAPAPEPQVDEEDHFSPEELRRLMGSFQSGTERGRSEAAGLPRRRAASPAEDDEPPVRPR